MSTPTNFKVNFKIAELQDYRWIDNGQSNLCGSLLRLFQELDRFFVRLGSECGATEYQFPTFIRAVELRKLDYFRSFPHLITFPVVLSPEDENIRTFIDGGMTDENSNLKLTQTSPICDCLTPAACYHFYIHHQGQRLAQARYMTTRANCYRRETHYLPLQRQWNFNMREIVCLGTPDEVKNFLGRYRERVSALFELLGWPISWDVATDPFFDPTRNAKFLLQTLDPVKTEMVYQGNLSIGSINYHRNYFGEAFQIQRDGEDAFSGCVAFGMERWIFTTLNQYGTNERDWAPLIAALHAVAPETESEDK